MRWIWLDVRHALRGLRRERSFAAVVVLTMALGIGGSTAIFTFVDGILLRPLPYPEEDRLVMICETNPERMGDFCAASPGNLADWARSSRTIEAMGLARDWPFMIRHGALKEGVPGGIVASSLFEVFSVRAERGRLLVPEDSDAGREPAAVVTHAYWQRKLAGAADVVGSRIQIDGESRTIVGVLPAGFEIPGLPRPEVFIPLWAERAGNHEWRGFRPFGRLARGVTLQAARSEMIALRASLEAGHPDANRGWGIAVDSLRERTVRSVRPALLAFLGAIGLVLLIGCANVAHLMLARATAREKEMIVRAALGAGPGRLIRQLLVEGLVLSMLGGALGSVVAAWGTDSILALAPPDIPRLADVRMSGSVLAFALLLSASVSLVFGLVPAWFASRPALHEALKEGRHRGDQHRGGRLRHALVAIEVALATMLLIGAGLLLRSFDNLLDWRPGFDRGNLLTVSVFSSPGDRPSAASAADLFARMEEGLRAIPGVAGAAAASAVPLRGGDGSEEYSIEGRPILPAGERPSVLWFDVGPAYFRTMGIPLLRGRSFNDADDARATPVAIVNETMARRLDPGGEAIGRRVTLAAHQATVEIVGVVADVRPFRPDAAPDPEIYWPQRQAPRWATMFAIRTASAGATAAAVRARLAGIDPDVDIGLFATMDQLVEKELVRPRFSMLLVSLFALLALALSTVGVYGILSYTTERRAHEIGVRLAFGARPLDVMRTVVTGGMAWAIAGIALGAAAAVPLMASLRHLLVNVSPADPATFAGVAGLLALVALAAASIPALRASRIDPMATLRGE
ncbi:MAG: ABC transporter permease [Acidobacteria bacterium]|nr:ABC transporter permease [Acidobacteriota bacterium]